MVQAPLEAVVPLPSEYLGSGPNPCIDEHEPHPILEFDDGVVGIVSKPDEPVETRVRSNQTPVPRGLVTGGRPELGQDPVKLLHHWHSEGQVPGARLHGVPTRGLTKFILDLLDSLAGRQVPILLPLRCPELRATGVPSTLQHVQGFPALGHAVLAQSGQVGRRGKLHLVDSEHHPEFHFYGFFVGSHFSPPVLRSSCA